MKIRGHDRYLVDARAQATTPEFWQTYRRWRPMVERAIAWLMKDGHRRCRYRGMARNQLGFSLRVAAINLQRLLTLGLDYDNGWKIADPRHWRAWGDKAGRLYGIKATCVTGCSPAHTGSLVGHRPGPTRTLRALPDEPFDAAALLTATADAKARICVRQAWYSVPASLARRWLTVKLCAEHLEVFAPGSDAIVAVHARSLHKHTQTLELDHYLEILVRKPGALPGATALAQARTSGKFTGLHDELWTRARRAHGDAAGTRALIEVLWLHRRLPAAAIAAGLRAALRVGSTDPAVVAIEARRWADGHGDDPTSRQRRRATPITVPATVPGATRPAPALDGYDQLLTTAGTSNGQVGS